MIIITIVIKKSKKANRVQILLSQNLTTVFPLISAPGAF